jgi:peptidoglycan hydrolase FlgJ
MSAADLQLSQTLLSTKANPTLPAARTVKQADRSAKEFEAVFINEMLSTMYAGVKTDGPFGGGPAESIFRSMMLDQYAKTIAEQGGFGLADQVKREILRAQEQAK